MKTFVQKLRALSMQTFGRDVVGSFKEFRVPFVGELWNSFHGGLAMHLGRYNTHLVLGQRSGQPVEALMFRRLSVTTVDPVPGVPVPPRCREIVGEDRRISPMQLYDLAGMALLNHYVVDMDQVRAWAETLRRRRDIVREDDEVLMRDPIPQRVGREEPADVSWRLTMLSPVEVM